MATLGRATAACLRSSPALCGARPQLPQLLAGYVITTQTHKEVQQCLLQYAAVLIVQAGR